MAPIQIVPIPDDDRNLNEFDSEEKLQAGEIVALRCDSFSYHAERVAKDALRTSQRFAARLYRPVAIAVQSMSEAVRARRQAWQRQPSEETVSSHLESEGVLVATVLAVVVLGYGGLLLTTGREPARTSPVSVVTPALAGLVPAIPDATHAVAPTPTTPVVTATPLGPPTDVRPRSRVVTAASLNTILRRTDARSLQHAFDDVRRETLSFHRCGMQMTAADRAVANCDGLVGSDGDGGGRRVRWTIDFQRTGSRWSIQRVASR